MKTNTSTSYTSLSMVGLSFALLWGLSANLLSRAAAPPGSWARKADMPEAIALFAGCAIDGIFYIAGGASGTNETALVPRRSLFAYDPKADVWSQKKDMKTPRWFVAGAAVNGIFYVIGGGGGYGTTVTSAVEAYDPKTDTWTSKSPLPSPRTALSACVSDGILYAIGGISINAEEVRTVEAYDPATDRWTQKAMIPSAGSFGSAQTVDNSIYAFYGIDTFRYDRQTDQWARKTSIRAGTYNCRVSASSVVDGLIYLMGGTSADLYTTYNNVLAYSPVDDRFVAKRRLPAKTLGATAATIDGKIYVVGGADRDLGVYSSGVVYKTLWEFDPQGGVASQLQSVIIDSPTSVRVAWQGDEGRLYGVESTTDLVKGVWSRLRLPTVTTLVATNSLVEATCTVVPSEQRFFRVIEAN